MIFLSNSVTFNILCEDVILKLSTRLRILVDDTMVAYADSRSRTDAISPWDPDSLRDFAKPAVDAGYLLDRDVK
jgi:hypothetical protein